MKTFRLLTSTLAIGTLLFVAATTRADHHEKDIVDTAIGASFNTLVKAVQAADLVDALKAEGPLTVFAPTDEAFAKVPTETMAALLRPENKEQLKAVLTYHVVAGKVMAGDVVKLNSAKTLNGETVKIEVKNGEVMVNGARVIKTDVTASNGVIHVIDSVILPKNLGPLSD